MFHIVVCIKQVPDTTNIRIDPETGNLIRQGVPCILNPYDAHAVAAAVQWKQNLAGKVTVLTMGPPSSAASLKECIEMGADRAVLLSARQFSGADTLATSFVLAEAIKEIARTEPVDLILFGKQAIDGDTAQVGPGVSVRLGYPLVTYAVSIHTINPTRRCMITERKTERWNEIIETTLPTVLTCEKEISEIPFASLPNLIHALKYEPEVWSAEEPILFNPDQIGLKGSPTTVMKTTTPEKHTHGKVIETSRTSPAAVAKIAMDQLAAAGLLSSLSGGTK